MAKVTVNALLVRARALIRKGWTQGPMARGKSGRPVRVTGPAACKFCAYGSLVRAEFELRRGAADGYYVYMAAFARLNRTVRRRFCTPGGLISYNETPGRKKSAVIALFDEAIG